MAILRNPQHERIAQARAGGKSAEEACLEAGLTRGKQAKAGWQGNCRKLANRPDIRARVEELQLVAAELAEIDAGWLLLKAKRLLGWNIDDFLGPVQPNGMRYFDMSQATRAQLEVLAELSQDEEFQPGDGEGIEPVTIRKIKIKPHNQVALLDLLMRAKGMINNKVALTDPAGDGPARLQLEVSWKPTQPAPPANRKAA